MNKKILFYSIPLLVGILLFAFKEQIASALCYKWTQPGFLLLCLSGLSRSGFLIIMLARNADKEVQTIDYGIQFLRLIANLLCSILIALSLHSGYIEHEISTVESSIFVQSAYFCCYTIISFFLVAGKSKLA